MKYVEKTLKFVTASVMVLLLLILSWQVFSRYVLNDPSTVTEELSRLFLITLGILGTALTFLQKKQLSLDLFVEKSSLKNKQRMEVAKDVAVMLLGVILFVGGIMMIKEKWSLGQTTPVLGFRLVYLYFLLPITGLIIFLSPTYKSGDGSVECN